MKTILETKRLVAREFLPLDAQNIFKLNSDPKVIQYTHNPPFSCIDEAEELIQNTIINNQYKKDGFGRWAIHLKSNGLFIGWAGLRRIEETQEVDLGYRFHKRFWNKGFATEISNAILEYGFQELNLSEVIGRTVPENVASIRVLEKTGMIFQKEKYVKEVLIKQYKISKEEYGK